MRLLLREHSDWARWRMIRHLAQLWEWRSASGQLKEIAARTKQDKATNLPDRLEDDDDRVLGFLPAVQ